MPKLPEFLQAENELDGNELVYIAQNSKTRKTTLQKIKEFVVGTATLLTTDKTPTGAINELKDGVDNLTESVSNNTTQLNAKMNKPITITGSLNQVLTTGWYRIPNATDGLPSGYTTENDFYLLVLNVDTKLDFLRYMLFDIRSNKVFTRNVAFGNFGEWEQYATTESITLTLLNGATAFGQSEGNGYFPTCIKTGNTVTIDGTVNVANVSDDTAILNNLPTPKQGHRWYTSYSINNVKIDLYLSYEGTLRVRSANGMTINDGLPINITYEVN